jgi:hypothetical protein
MEFLSKIAAVLVTLLLYFVIAILQMPRTARAAEGLVINQDHEPASLHGVNCCFQDNRA